MDEFEDWNADEDTITVFDLVHRGRQLKEIKKQNAFKTGKMEVMPPRILSPGTGTDTRQRSLGVV